MLCFHKIGSVSLPVEASRDESSPRPSAVLAGNQDEVNFGCSAEVGRADVNIAEDAGHFEC